MSDQEQFEYYDSDGEDSLAPPPFSRSMSVYSGKTDGTSTSVLVKEGLKEVVAPSSKPKELAILEQKYFRSKMLASSRGNMLAFCSLTHCWTFIFTEAFQKEISTSLGQNNVSVSYDKAFEPYKSAFIKRCSENPVTSIPTSVCIGFRRYKISLEDFGVVFEECDTVVDSLRGDSSENSRVIRQFCHKPLHYSYIPRWINMSKELDAYTYVSQVFWNRVDLEAFMWTIGNAIIDPVSVSKLVILYGPTHTGKTELVSSLSLLFPGSCGSLQPWTMVGDKIAHDAETYNTIASNRVATVVETNFNARKMNVGLIKSLVGGETVRINGGTARTHCSVYTSTNNPPSPFDSSDYVDGAVMRRLVILPAQVDVRAIDTQIRFMPADESSRMSFLARCIHVRSQHEMIPATVRSFLLVLLGSTFMAFEGVLELDVSASSIDCARATNKVAQFVDVTNEALCDMASQYSDNLVMYYGASRVLKGMKLRQ